MCVGPGVVNLRSGKATACWYECQTVRPAQPSVSRGQIRSTGLQGRRGQVESDRPTFLQGVGRPRRGDGPFRAAPGPTRVPSGDQPGNPCPVAPERVHLTGRSSQSTAQESTKQPRFLADPTPYSLASNRRAENAAAYELLAWFRPPASPSLLSTGVRRRSRA